MVRILLTICVCVLFGAPAGAQPKAPPVAVDDRSPRVAVGKAAPCTVCSPCECAAGVCPACPATSSGPPALLMIRGVMHERGGDGVYRVVPSKASADGKDCGCAVCPCHVNSPQTPCPLACERTSPAPVAPPLQHSFAPVSSCANGQCGAPPTAFRRR